MSNKSINGERKKRVALSQTLCPNKEIMKFYLRLKPWQLFILLFSPMSLPAIFVNSNSPGSLFGITWLIWMVILLGWLYSIGITSNDRLPSTLKKSTVVYKIGYLTPFIYGHNDLGTFTVPCFV